MAEIVRRFAGEYRLIDPSGYLEGNSFICHLLCSPNCSKYLSIARGALEFVKQHMYEDGFDRWKSWLVSVEE